MPNIKKTMKYELQSPIEYAHKGNMETASFIEISAPTSKNMSECADLKQAFFQAMPKSDNVEKDDKDDKDEGSLDDLDGESIMMLISMSPNVKLKCVLVSAIELFSSGIALVDGEEKVTKPILDELTQDDLECMLGEYYLNFILASWLTRMKLNSSK